MIFYGNKFYILKHKKPYPSFKHTHSLDEINGYDDIGIRVEYPFVVVDVDDLDQAEYLADILDNAKIVYGLMYTDSGSHFWFKSEVPMRNRIKANTVLGIDVDIKSHGKDSQVKIKSDGEYREWVYRPDPSEIDYIPPILKPMKSKIKFNHRDVGRSERHQHLLDMVYPLAREGFTPNEIYKSLLFINKYLLISPLDKDDIRAMSIDNPTLTEAAFYEEGKLNTNAVSLSLRTDLKLYLKDGMLWVYDHKERIYKIDELLIETEIHKLLPNLRNADRGEIQKKLLLNMNIHPPIIKEINKHSVIVKNGILNLANGKLYPSNDSIFTTRALNVRYNKKATSSVLDGMMNKITCGNKELEKLLYQMIAYSLVSHCDFQKAFLLIGEGQNGKSVLLTLITQFLGEQNVATVPLNGLKEPQKVSRLLNKYANVGDDIGKRIDETENFKSLVAGKPVDVKLLYQNMFSFTNTAKFIFAANSLPNSPDKSHGYFRRWEIIPFEAEFKETDPDFDPFIEEKLLQDEVFEYLLLKCIDAYKQLLQDKGFVKSRVTAKAMDQYKEDSDSLYAWVKMKPKLHDRDIKTSYQDYIYFCGNTGIKHPYEWKNFRRRLPKLVPGLVSKNTTRKGEQCYVWQMDKN